MPGNKPSQRRRKAAEIERRRHRFLISVTLMLSLFAAWAVLTHSGALNSTFSEKRRTKQTVSIESLNSSSPSKEYVYAGGGLVATEDDFQPPVFPNGCPPTVNVAAAFQCPYPSGVGVNYTNPVATDNNPSVTVLCDPPSGSTFPVGANTVTCTATDASGNTATCSFAVNVFSVPGG